MTETGKIACDLLIVNGHVVTVDDEDRIIEDGAVAISGHRIAAVGPTAAISARYQAAGTIDARGALVHPGFIDAHIHISQYTSRSVLPRMEGTAITMGDWKGALRGEDEHASAMLAALDYFRSGYTGFVDPGTIFEPDAVASAADASGIRIWLTDPYVADRGHALGEHNPELMSPSFLARWPKSTDEALKRIGTQLRRNDDRNGLVHGFIGVYGEDTCTDEIYRVALQTARRAGVQFQEHRGYNPAAYRRHEAALGHSAVRYLTELGILGAGTTLVHMNVVHPEDVAPLARSGTALVWCPYSQLRMMGQGGAEPRMVELARAGVRVGLASDIPRTISFDALGSLAIGNAVACGTPLMPRELLRMRTIDAAATIGAADRLGSIAVGKTADIVIRAAVASETLAVDAQWEAAALGMSSAPAAVIVNGVVVFRDGVPVRFDAAAVVAQARQSVRRIVQQIGLSR